MDITLYGAGSQPEITYSMPGMPVTDFSVSGSTAPCSESAQTVCCRTSYTGCCRITGVGAPSAPPQAPLNPAPTAVPPFKHGSCLTRPLYLTWQSADPDPDRTAWPQNDWNSSPISTAPSSSQPSPSCQSPCQTQVLACSSADSCGLPD